MALMVSAVDRRDKLEGLPERHLRVKMGRVQRERALLRVLNGCYRNEHHEHGCHGRCNGNQYDRTLCRLTAEVILIHLSIVRDTPVIM